MASSSSSKELQPPDNVTDILRTFEGYKAALAQMKIPEQIEQLTRINAELEAQTQAMLASTIRAPLESYVSNLDILVPRTTPTPLTPPSPRGQGSLRSPSQQPTAADLLFGANRGKRLAAKLVAANARSIAGHRR